MQQKRFNLSTDAFIQELISVLLDETKVIVLKSNIADKLILLGRN